VLPLRHEIDCLEPREEQATPARQADFIRGHRLPHDGRRNPGYSGTPNQERYPGQKIHVVDVEGYADLVPFVESEEEVFLKTIIPSRKATKIYLGGAE